jgi:hypothetical protein
LVAAVGRDVSSVAKNNNLPGTNLISRKPKANKLPGTIFSEIRVAEFKKRLVFFFKKY